MVTHIVEIEYLIPRDVSRCNDDKCPISAFCERNLQMFIDFKKGEKCISVTNFKGSAKNGLCEHFLNVDID
jgi:hypothetical protein